MLCYIIWWHSRVSVIIVIVVIITITISIIVIIIADPSEAMAMDPLTLHLNIFQACPNDDSCIKPAAKTNTIYDRNDKY